MFVDLVRDDEALSGRQACEAVHLEGRFSDDFYIVKCLLGVPNMG